MAFLMFYGCKSWEFDEIVKEQPSVDLWSL